jgi:hypothetical protein
MAYMPHYYPPPESVKHRLPAPLPQKRWTADRLVKLQAVAAGGDEHAPIRMRGNGASLKHARRSSARGQLVGGDVEWGHSTTFRISHTNGAQQRSRTRGTAPAPAYSSEGVHTASQDFSTVVDDSSVQRETRQERQGDV